MRPISWKNSHANRSEVNAGGRKRQDRISQVSSTQLSGENWVLFADVKKMTATDGDTVSTYISQVGPNATTKGADPVYRDGGVNGKSISFNGAQALNFGEDVLAAGTYKVSIFSAHTPVASAAGKFLLALGNPNYYSRKGIAFGISGSSGEDYGALGTPAVFVEGDNIAKAEPQVLSVAYDRTAPTQLTKIKIHNNGVLDPTTTVGMHNSSAGDFETGANSGMTWGARHDLSGVFYNGNISVLSLLARELTESEHIVIARIIMGRAKI